MMESIRLGGDISEKKLLTRTDEIQIDDDRDLLPVKLMPVVEGAKNECHFLEVRGHDGL